MPFLPRLIALDVDGTVVDESNVVPSEVRDAITAVQANGITVVLATGRSLMSALSVLDDLGLPEAEHVFSNGAVTAIYPPARVVDVLTFDPRPVVQEVRRAIPEARFAVEVVGQGYHVTEPFPDGELHGTITVVPLEELIDRDVTRVVVRDPGATVEEFDALAARMGMEGVTYHVGYSAWLDLAPHGVDKAHGLARVAARAGISAAEVLTIGDGRNDISMLSWAGRGVAMGGSPSEVVAAADAVTGTLSEGGLIDELSRWI
ncbi:MAG: HAD family hydrolase [Propioniciclava sp.]